MTNVHVVINCVSHDALNGRREVFNKMSEAEKGWKCLANDAKISVTNWKKNTLNDFGTKN